MRRLPLLALLTLLCSFGCATDDDISDAGEIRVPRDTGVGMPAPPMRPDTNFTPPPGDMGIDPRPDMGIDRPDDGMIPAQDDMGLPPPADSQPTPSADVLMTGGQGLILRGVVLAPGEAFQGEVHIIDDTIECVAPARGCSDQAPGAVTLETRGIISPGLIDGHNHLTYNFLDEWVPPSMQLFNNRYEWADDPDYEEHIEPFAANRSSNAVVCPAVKWGEIRSLLHGTTTVQGQSPQRTCTDRLARNADLSYHNLGPDHLRTTISSVRDIRDEDDGLDRTSLVEQFANGETTRFAVHMAEGLTGRNVENEFSSYLGEEDRGNAAPRTINLLHSDGAPYITSILIHALGLTQDELRVAADFGAYVVWSPSSNIVLYGMTADIELMLELGMTVGLGPDWTVSGEDDMLSELRFARAYGRQMGISALTGERLWRMATSDGAEVLGLGDRIGTLAPGYRADILVVGREGADPYDALIDAGPEDVRLVLLDGEAYAGDEGLMMATAVNDACEVLDACGTRKFVCVADTPGADDERAGETMAEIERQLQDRMAEFGRDRGELLELIQCR
ncbi:MAG: amidohydrolase family protein [Bradymonadia bacterium]